MRRMLFAAMSVFMLAGCMNPEGADTFSDSGVLSGSTILKAECARNAETAVWVVVDGAGECIRYFHSGLKDQNPLVHVWFHGDRMSQSFNGNAWVHGYYSRDANPAALQAQAEAGEVDSGVPYIRFSRPGLYGSSGNHRRRRLPEEVAIVDAAVDAIKARHGIQSYALSGQSGGGHLVASLLTRRDDISCAVITSGVASVRERSKIRGWGGRDITGFSSFFDPIDHVAQIPVKADRRIFVMGDPADSNVPFSTQADYHNALRAAGHHSALVRARGRGKSRHGLAHAGVHVVRDCIDGVRSDEIVRRHSNVF